MLILAGVLAVLAAVQSWPGKTYTSNGDTSAAGEWKQVWSDEFDDLVLDPLVWEHDVGYGKWGNEELQYYTALGNLEVKDGMLIITAKHETMGDAEYTSARIKTKGKVSFLHGRIEARMKLPNARGVWPAFWMMGTGTLGQWPLCGEIDIMEAVNACDKAYGSIHWPVRSDEEGNVLGYSSQSSSGNTAIETPDDWHVYAIEWSETEIRWYIDDTCYHTYKIDTSKSRNEPFQKPFYLLFNVAVGGSWPGAPKAEQYPQSMYVDYVRAYSWES